MSKPKSFVCWLILALSISACSLIEGEKSTIRLLGIESLTQRDEAVIIARLGAYASALKPSFRIAKEKGAILIESSGAPPDDMVKFLLSHPGVFAVKSEGGTVWFTDQDIKDAVVGFNDQQMPVINFKLANFAQPPKM